MELLNLAKIRYLRGQRGITDVEKLSHKMCSLLAAQQKPCYSTYGQTYL